MDPNIRQILEIADRCRQSGNLTQAEAVYHRAIRLQADNAEARNGLGQTYVRLGRVGEAIEQFRRAVQIDSQFGTAHNNLGLALVRVGEHRGAAEEFQKAIEVRPTFDQAYNNLGLALHRLGEFTEAVDCFDSALLLAPRNAEYHENLGLSLLALRRPQALDAIKKAIELQPDRAGAVNLLGEAVRQLRRPAEAVEVFHQALQLKPRYADAYGNLGLALMDCGRLGDATAAFREARRLDPHSPSLHSHYLYALHFHPEYDVQTIFQEHRIWARRFEEPLKSEIRPHPNSRDPRRRLRLGYVSPDMTHGSLAAFLLPILQCHNSGAFEIFFYNGSLAHDALTRRMEARVDHWRDAAQFTDMELAGQIRADQIDILVDLAVHSPGNRQPVFARKPAPVQATYLGYCSTTGMAAMDYRLTDARLDPAGLNDRYYSERTIHLPDCYWVYQPAGPTPSINGLPALETGRVTFGHGGGLDRVTPMALDAWRQILRQLPESRLILRGDPGEHREECRRFFAVEGVKPDRIEFVGLRRWEEYIALYEQVDIALDPFPFSGRGTTCDALWMGVPVVTLPGATAVSRSGLSILSAVGLPDLAARSIEQYVQIALGMAHHPRQLADLRAGLRDRLQNSPLTDAVKFTAGLEEAYRRMWSAWATGGESGVEPQ